MKKLTTGGIIVVIFVLVVAGFMGYLIFKSKSNVQMGQSEYHIHPSVRIQSCGQPMPLPKNTGIPTLHTHEDLPYLHLEGAPSKLGDFFKIIHTRFNATCFGDYCNGDKCPLSSTPGQLKVYVNGTQNFDYDQYNLRDRDDILIEFK